MTDTGYWCWGHRATWLNLNALSYRKGSVDFHRGAAESGCLKGLRKAVHGLSNSVVELVTRYLALPQT